MREVFYLFRPTYFFAFLTADFLAGDFLEAETEAFLLLFPFNCSTAIAQKYSSFP